MELFRQRPPLLVIPDLEEARTPSASTAARVGGGDCQVVPFRVEGGTGELRVEEDPAARSAASAFALATPCIVVASVAGAVLVVRGGGEAAAIRCNWLGLCLLAASTCALSSTISLETITIWWEGGLARGFRSLPWSGWASYVFWWSVVNALGLTMFALLGHATWAAAQLLLLAAAPCWVLWSCSVAFSLWTRASWSRCADIGDVPLVDMLQAMPRWRILLAWVTLATFGFGALHFKPTEEMGWPAGTSLLENFLAMSFVGLLLSCVLCAVVFSATRWGRQLLSCKRRLPEEDLQLILLQSVPRAVLISMIGHSAIIMILVLLGNLLMPRKSTGTDLEDASELTVDAISFFEVQQPRRSRSEESDGVLPRADSCSQEDLVTSSCSQEELITSHVDNAPGQVCAGALEEELRCAIKCADIDADKLSLIIERALRAGADPEILATAEERFACLIDNKALHMRSNRQ